MKVLITGGCGYIGSHTAIEFLDAGHEVVIVDDLSNSFRETLDCIKKITGESVFFIEGRIDDSALLDAVFLEHHVDAVIHFAGLKSVAESTGCPLQYYKNNVSGSVELFSAMEAAGVFNLVFSSSATVYGSVELAPIPETTPTGVPTNPYGWSKLMAEQILKDLAQSDSRWSIALLRYFNPVGAHASGLIGESPRGTPNNLVPYIGQVALGIKSELKVFGGDYPTKDGTGVRDYIHVTDLSKGHLKALDYILGARGVNVWNLGTGVGHSVLDVISSFEKISGVNISYNITSRRNGDIAECWSDPRKAYDELGWRAELGLEKMMEDTWRWLLYSSDKHGQ